MEDGSNSLFSAGSSHLHVSKPNEKGQVGRRTMRYPSAPQTPRKPTKWVFLAVLQPQDSMHHRIGLPQRDNQA